MRRLDSFFCSSYGLSGTLYCSASRWVCAAVIGLVGAASVHAQSFSILYDFTGAPGNQASTAATPSTVPVGITAAALTRGSGINPVAGGDAIIGSLWSSGGLDLNDYFSFGITPSVTSPVNLSTLSFWNQRTPLGPSSIAIRTSADGFTSNLFSYSLTAGMTSDFQTFDLSGISDFQNMTSALTIRIYGFTSSAPMGTYRLNSVGAGTGLRLSGTAVETPEPGSVALFLPAAGVLGLILHRRRRSRV